MKRKETKEINGVTYKECTQCKILKPLNEFYNRKQKTKFGLGKESLCIICSKKRNSLRPKKTTPDAPIKGFYKVVCVYCGETTYKKSPVAVYCDAKCRKKDYVEKCKRNGKRYW